MRIARAFIVSAAVVCAAQQIRGQQCTEKWDPPRVLEVADGRPAYVEAAAVATRGDEILLLGSPAWIWAQRDAFDPPPLPAGGEAYFNRWRANASILGFALEYKIRTAIPLRPFPVGLRRRIAASRGEDGTIHVVWFAPNSGSNNDDDDGAIWYSEVRNEKWTDPLKIFSADKVGGLGEKASLLINGSNVHVVVPYQRNNVTGIAYIRRANGRWTTVETRREGLPSYQVSAQLIVSDSLVVAFDGATSSGVAGPMNQNVYVIRAAVTDTIWPASKIIFRTGIIPIRSLKLYRFPAVAGRSTRLALVWGFYQRQKTSSDTVFAATSPDNGVTWRSPTMGLLPIGLGGFAWFSQTQDGKGDIHLAAASANPGTGEGFIYYSVFSNESWRPFTSIPSSPVASAITLSPLQRGGLLLLWGKERPAGGGATRPAPVTMYTFIRRTCSHQ